jgi:hypothetical protein
MVIHQNQVFLMTAGINSDTRSDTWRGGGGGLGAVSNTRRTHIYFWAILLLDRYSLLRKDSPAESGK